MDKQTNDGKEVSGTSNKSCFMQILQGIAIKSDVAQGQLWRPSFL